MFSSNDCSSPHRPYQTTDPVVGGCARRIICRIGTPDFLLHVRLLQLRFPQAFGRAMQDSQYALSVPTMKLNSGRPLQLAGIWLQIHDIITHCGAYYECKNAGTIYVCHVNTAPPPLHRGARHAWKPLRRDWLPRYSSVLFDGSIKTFENR